MSANTSNDFTFTLCVSQEGYGTKPTKEQVPRITFEPRSLTIEDALQCATEGRAFCYSFSTAQQDGIITTKDKTEANFLSTSTVIYDFDDMGTPMFEYIESLPYKPSFAYPTYSDGKNGLSRFRLAYVFDYPVWGVSQFNTLYQAIATANAFVPEVKSQHGGWDKRNVSQLYYGTKAQSSTYNGHTVYSVGDFQQFADYSKATPTVSVSKEIDSSKYETTIDAEFLHDFTHLSQKGFYTKYRDVFYLNYEPSLSTPLILDESNMFFLYPEDYVCVKHKRRGKKTLRWEIDENRKKKLFVTAHMMLFNLPSLSIENLIYNLALERQWYYDNSDGKISNEVLIQTAINAFTKPFPLEPSKHGRFKLNAEYWERQGKTPNQAKMMVRRLLKEREVKRLYNPSLTRKENLKVLKENGITISEKTLKRMVSRADIKVDDSSASRTYLSCCPDSDTIVMLKLIHRCSCITQAQLAKALGVSVPTVKRYLKAMRGRLITREGDNRNGEWIVLPPFCDYLSR